MAGNGIPDHYAVLELADTASEQEVRRAYRRLAVRWHPDKNPQDVTLAEIRFKEVSEAYEVLRDPAKRRQYDRMRTSGREAPGTSSWFSDSASSSFGDDLWEDTHWETRRPGRAFRNPFDVFKEFFGDTDPWADITPRSQRRQNASQAPRPETPKTGRSFWSSMDNDPFFSSPFFSSPFFSRSGFSLLDQFNRAWSQPQTSRDRISQPASRNVAAEDGARYTEIKIQGTSDSEDESEDESESEEEVENIVIEDTEEDEVAANNDDEELREAIRLSLLQEEARKRELEERADHDLAEAIRRSLAEQPNGTAAQDRMEIDNQAH